MTRRCVSLLESLATADRVRTVVHTAYGLAIELKEATEKNQPVHGSSTCPLELNKCERVPQPTPTRGACRSWPYRDLCGGTASIRTASIRASIRACRYLLAMKCYSLSPTHCAVLRRERATIKGLEMALTVVARHISYPDREQAMLDILEIVKRVAVGGGCGGGKRECASGILMKEVITTMLPTLVTAFYRHTTLHKFVVLALETLLELSAHVGSKHLMASQAMIEGCVHVVRVYIDDHWTCLAVAALLRMLCTAMARLVCVCASVRVRARRRLPRAMRAGCDHSDAVYLPNRPRTSPGCRMPSVCSIPRRYVRSRPSRRSRIVAASSARLPRPKLLRTPRRLPTRRPGRVSPQTWSSWVPSASS